MGIRESDTELKDTMNTAISSMKADGTLTESSFHYTKQVLDGNQAILEFETQIDGKYAILISHVRNLLPFLGGPYPIGEQKRSYTRRTVRRGTRLG